MQFTFVAEPATFLERPNRYLVLARLHRTGEVVRVHCPDPGRLHELLIPNADVKIHVSPAGEEQAGSAPRRTTHDLRFVEHPEHGGLISLDSRLPNALFWEGLQTGFFPQFRHFQAAAREASLPCAPATGVRSRIDFRLIDAEGRTCWVEVKSATLVTGRTAYFPDAVTARGRRHVGELTQLVAAGVRAAVCFVVQRPDADLLRPQWERDPDFAAALAAASCAGVELLATTVRVTLQEAILDRIIPVLPARRA
jgi:sugar fermentation stimulation protein A